MQRQPEGNRPNHTPLPTLRRWLVNAANVATPKIDLAELGLTDEDLRKDLVHGRG